MLRFGATLLSLLLAAGAHASDHEPVLDARRQGDIAPFGEILAVARAAAGGRTVLLDAKFVDSRSDALMEVYLRRPSNGQVLVVTVDAVKREVVRSVARGAPGAGVGDPASANSRPIDPPRSAASGAAGSAGGKDPDDGGKDPDGGGKDAGGGGKDGGGGKGGDDGGKNGRGGRDGGTGDGKGGDTGNGGGKGGSGK